MAHLKTFSYQAHLVTVLNESFKSNKMIMSTPYITYVLIKRITDLLAIVSAKGIFAPNKYELQGYTILNVSSQFASFILSFPFTYLSCSSSKLLFGKDHKKVCKVLERTTNFSTSLTEKSLIRMTDKLEDIKCLRLLKNKSKMIMKTRNMATKLLLTDI